MSNRLQWGIMGTGKIAEVFARALDHSRTGWLTAVGSRTQEAAENFGAQFDIPHRHGSYAALLEDSSVQAVYISMIHPLHEEWAIKAAQAGKHILCEKPLTMNASQARRVIEAARANRVFLMEAFMYRCHPQTAQVVELLHAGTIGQVRMIQAAFGFHFPWKPEHRVLKKELGGGAILDVGCYCASMARLAAGAAIGKGTFAEPERFEAIGKIGAQTHIDEYSAAIAHFPGGIVAQLACACQLLLDNVVRIYGTEGHILIPIPWGPSKDGEKSSIFLHRNGAAAPEELLLHPPASLFTMEADAVARWVAEGRTEPVYPAMTWNDTLGNMALLDRWRQAIGMKYDHCGD